MRRIITALAALFLFLVPWAMAEEDAVFIDRITRPDAEPEFIFPEDAELFQVIFPNLQEADCALLISGDDTVMIDCSTRGYAYRVVNMLKQLGIEEIDLILNTHPHSDHLLGLQHIASAVNVKEIAFCFPADASVHMVEVLEVARRQGIDVSWYEDEARFPVGDGFIDVWLKGDEDWNLNERSAQMRVQFGERTALFTADALEKTMQRLVEVIPPELLDCDWMKHPHHGLEPLNDAFLEAVSPEFVVITHQQGDKTFKTRAFLLQREVPFAFTYNAFLSFTTDGRVWLAEKIPVRPYSGK